MVVWIQHKLVDKSKESGADAVKFQTFNADTIATCDAAKAKYQINGNKNETQYNMLRNLELGVKDYIELKKHCELIDIEFMSTAFGKKELDILINCGIKSIKVASGEITNKPLLEYMAKQSYKNRLKVIISTGMSTIEDIENALDIFTKEGLSKELITIMLHKRLSPDINELNMNALKLIKETLNVQLVILTIH